MGKELLKNVACELKTERLMLRPLRIEDEDAVLALLQNDEIKKTYMVMNFPSAESAAEYFRLLMKLSLGDTSFVRVICLDDRVIGFINDVDNADGVIELGYVIHPSEKNRGYATEALKAVIDEMFRAGYTAVRCGHFAKNLASARVMEKCGMKRIEMTDEIEYRGVWHHCVYCQIKKTDMA